MVLFVVGGESDSDSVGATSLTVTLTGVTAGHLLVAECVVGNGTAVPTISGGGTWTQAFIDHNYATVGNTWAVWYCTSATGGSTTVTFGSLASQTCHADVTEWAFASAFDLSATPADSTSNVSNAVSPAASGDLLISILDDTFSGSGVAATAGTGYTLGYTKLTGDGSWVGYEELDSAASGSHTASWTVGTAFTSIVLLAFKPSAVAFDPSAVPWPSADVLPQPYAVAGF